MGTPEFAVNSLKLLFENGYQIIAVVTAPDKPSGRGMKVQESAVKKYALEKNFKILQPENLKNSLFQEELKNLKADLFVVVAFRMLPESVWSLPSYGTINLHASLLPDYRGAAPINRVLMNGEIKTGVTTFFIEKEIDTGQIIYQEEVEIHPDENAGQLHDRLMITGGNLIVRTVQSILDETIQPVSQNQIISERGNIKSAPKIFKEDCEINWHQTTEKIYNFIRGLSPYPTSWFKIYDKTKNELSFKVFSCQKFYEKHSFQAGKVFSDNKTYLKIAALDGYIYITDIQMQGKKRMSINDMLNGFDIRPFVL
jgi:methionyl-tRNA formyltransferase